jgi:signal transduction histidine kinase/ligand-binding sensor domain-containing protein
LAFCAGIFPARLALAIDPDRAMSQYVHDRWGAEQGLPRGAIYAITQTLDGYLWIGAEAGLIRFDGWSFVTIKEDSGARPLPSVLGLTPDNDGCLWTRLLDLSIVRYCRGVFDKAESHQELHSSISAMTRGNGGQILAAKMDSGAFLFHGQSQLLVSAEELPRSPILSLTQMPSGDIWLGTRDAGLFRLAGGKTTSIRNGLPDDKINCLLPAGDRDLWIGTDNGIVRWDGRQIISAGLPRALNHFQALAMTKDRDGNIWVGTDSLGLLRFNSHGVAALKEDVGVASTAITAVFEDREGNVWIGSAGGLERLRDSAFVTYSLPEGLPSEGSKPVFVDSENHMWFAPVNGGLWWVQNERHGRVHAANLDSDVVYSIAGASRELWLGRKRGGLTRLRFDQGGVTTRTYTQADGLTQNSVYSVYLSHDGAVWAGTLSGGVSRLGVGSFTTYTNQNGLASNTVTSILETSDETMWFATPGGLSALSKRQWRQYGASDGLPSEDVLCLFEDSKNTLWVGTAAGLAFRRPGGFQVPAGLPPALREQILGLAEDRYGSLWIATSNHVLEVNREKLWGGLLTDSDLRLYGPADGLRGVEGVKRHKSVVADPFGRIWVSTNLGISVVNPARVRPSSAPATVEVQAVSADGDPVARRRPIRISPGRRRIVFGYVGLNLSAPERVRFRYRLDDYDSGWSAPSTAREATYTNLPAGRYRFRVIASNPDGVWNSSVTVIPFEIQPRLQQTWWFKVWIGLSCVLAGWALYRLRLRQLTSQLNLRFQERLAERTRIAQELHDTLLQGFLSASMHLHVAAGQLPAESPENPQFSRILLSTSQVIEEGRNALRGLRSSRSDSTALDQAFAQIARELDLQDKIDFRVIVVGQPRPLHPLLRDEVYRIGREALINAFRHARAEKIEVELKYSIRHLHVFVRDDGCGIDPQALQSGVDGHFGLSGMRERADRIGARFHVFTKVAAGTEIELAVPSRVAFQDEPSRALARVGTLFRRRSAPKVADSD